MGKLKKKNASGTAKTYLTRNQALKKLQISLADFRRLCILKGVFPHDPKYKKKITGGNASAVTTFYHIKDIKALLHEPILSKFREYKIYAKKMRKLIGKKEWFLANRLLEQKPSYTLQHIIKERYPRFKDALLDLDDALCHLFCFASIPPSGGFTEDMAVESQRLCREFLHYVMRTHTLEKVFLSVKGIYYQAGVFGETLTWLAPYEFYQYVPPNVDFRVMITFLEFYQNLLGFVNFKLYQDSHLEYPPVVDNALESAGVGLMSLKIRSLDDDLSAETEILPSIDKTLEQDAGVLQVIEQRMAEKEIRKSLFKGLKFYLSREVPKDALVFVISSFGGEVGWNHTTGAPYEENDTSITHHIVDRPIIQNLYTNRVYLQPQWIFDSVNQKKRVDESLYAPGVTLPPHLSPFIQEEDDDVEEKLHHDEEIDDNGSFTAIDDISKAEKKYMEKLYSTSENAVNSAEDSTEKSLKKQVKNSNTSRNTKGTAVDKERKELALSMMSKKKRKLYEAMQRTVKSKTEEKKRLQSKREKLAKK